MKNILLLIFICCIYTNAHAQFGSGQIISPVHIPNSIFSCDMDGDGDMDVLYPVMNEPEIAWHENTDGLGNFGPEQIILTNNLFPHSVNAADIDGDGDMDVVVTLSFTVDRNITWFENDGTGNFVGSQIVTIDVSGGEFIYIADVDGDDDMDVLSASGNGKIAWYENLDGLGNFGSQQIITIDAAWATSIFVEDIDTDGDMDVIVSAAFDDKIIWYENTNGQGNFGSEQIISTNADNAQAVYAADLDMDGDMDVLSASSNDHKISWYENDGTGNFGPQLNITTNALLAFSVYAMDIDLDGDMDVLTAFDEKIAWHENIDGQGNFGPQQLVSVEGRVFGVYPSDLDADGDIDLIASDAIIFDGKTAWYENSTILSVDESGSLKFHVYPNPTSGIINVQSISDITQIEVYNSLGQLVLTNIKDCDENKIDLSDVGQGLYFLKLTDRNGNLATKKVVKK